MRQWIYLLIVLYLGCWSWATTPNKVLSNEWRSPSTINMGDCAERQRIVKTIIPWEQADATQPQQYLVYLGWNDEHKNVVDITSVRDSEDLSENTQLISVKDDSNGCVVCVGIDAISILIMALFGLIFYLISLLH